MAATSEKDHLPEEIPDNPSPSEAPTEILLPSNQGIATDPLSVVAFLSKRRDELVEELAMIKASLDAAWAVVPVDKSILRAAYKADIVATCRECGRPTKWRTGTGFAQCQPSCTARAEGRAKRAKLAIPDSVWDILDGKVGMATDPESLDDDE